MPDLVHLPHCTSTNDAIAEILNDTLPFAAVYTTDQRQGRGTYGNRWLSRPGENLAFTFALRQDLWPGTDAWLSFFVANSARRALSRISGQKISVKWPNDLILQRKKTGGILMEKRKIHHTAYCLIGIGINVNQESFPEMPWVGSLKALTGQTYDPSEIARELFDGLKSSPQSIEAELAEYYLHLFRRDKVSVFERNGIRQNGIIRRVDPEGWLEVDLENEGPGRFFHKEIRMLY